MRDPLLRLQYPSTSMIALPSFLDQPQITWEDSNFDLLLRCQNEKMRFTPGRKYISGFL
jgi:hypothetical protein